MNDFERVLIMLSKANQNFKAVEGEEGECPSIEVPSPYPENYSTGVIFSFNDDGSLYSVHSFEPDEDEE